MSDEDSRTVTKRELVNRIAEETGQTKVVVRDVLQRFLDSVIDELVDGNRLEFRDFGVFEVRERPARVAQNPRTLEKVPVPAKHVVRFKAGRVMRERVCDEIVAQGEGAEGGNSARSTGSNGASPSGGSAGTNGADPRSPKVNGAGATHGVAGQSGAGQSGAGRGTDPQQDAAETEKTKPLPPTPPPAKPGSPF